MFEGEITMTIGIRAFRTKFLTALIAAVAALDSVPHTSPRTATG